MIASVIVDTGPLVAFFSRADRYHEWAVSTLKQIPTPLLTCEPVITEAAYLLSPFHGAEARLLDYVRQGVLKIAFSLQEEVVSVGGLMRRFRDQPMSLADACLVRMSELIEPSAVLTLDGDFRIYRRHHRRVIPLICP